MVIISVSGRLAEGSLGPVPTPGARSGSANTRWRGLFEATFLGVVSRSPSPAPSAWFPGVPGAPPSVPGVPAVPLPERRQRCLACSDFSSDTITAAWTRRVRPSLASSAET